MGISIILLRQLSSSGLLYMFFKPLKNFGDSLSWTILLLTICLRFYEALLTSTELLLMSIPTMSHHLIRSKCYVNNIKELESLSSQNIFVNYTIESIARWMRILFSARDHFHYSPISQTHMIESIMMYKSPKLINFYEFISKNFITSLFMKINFLPSERKNYQLECTLCTEAVGSEKTKTFLYSQLSCSHVYHLACIRRLTEGKMVCMGCYNEISDKVCKFQKKRRRAFNIL